MAYYPDDVAPAYKRPLNDEVDRDLRLEQNNRNIENRLRMFKDLGPVPQVPEPDDPDNEIAMHGLINTVSLHLPGVPQRPMPMDGGFNTLNASPLGSPETQELIKRYAPYIDERKDNSERVLDMYKEDMRINDPSIPNLTGPQVQAPGTKTASGTPITPLDSEELSHTRAEGSYPAGMDPWVRPGETMPTKPIREGLGGDGGPTVEEQPVQEQFTEPVSNVPGPTPQIGEVLSKFSWSNAAALISKAATEGKSHEEQALAFERGFILPMLESVFENIKAFMTPDKADPSRDTLTSSKKVEESFNAAADMLVPGYARALAKGKGTLGSFGGKLPGEMTDREILEKWLESVGDKNVDKLSRKIQEGYENVKDVMPAANLNKPGQQLEVDKYTAAQIDQQMQKLMLDETKPDNTAKRIGELRDILAKNKDLPASEARSIEDLISYLEKNQPKKAPELTVIEGDREARRQMGRDLKKARDEFDDLNQLRSRGENVDMDLWQLHSQELKARSDAMREHSLLIKNAKFYSRVPSLDIPFKEAMQAKVLQKLDEAREFRTQIEQYKKDQGPKDLGAARTPEGLLNFDEPYRPRGGQNAPNDRNFWASSNTKSTIKDMVREGRSREEIASFFDVSIGTLNSGAYRNGIKLPPRKPQSANAAETPRDLVNFKEPNRLPPEPQSLEHHIQFQRESEDIVLSMQAAIKQQERMLKDSANPLYEAMVEKQGVSIGSVREIWGNNLKKLKSDLENTQKLQQDAYKIGSKKYGEEFTDEMSRRTEAGNTPGDLSAARTPPEDIHFRTAEAMQRDTDTLLRQYAERGKLEKLIEDRMARPKGDKHNEEMIALYKKHVSEIDHSIEQHIKGVIEDMDASRSTGFASTHGAPAVDELNVKELRREQKKLLNEIGTVDHPYTLDPNVPATDPRVQRLNEITERLDTLKKAMSQNPRSVNAAQTPSELIHYNEPNRPKRGLSHGPSLENRQKLWDAIDRHGGDHVAAGDELNLSRSEMRERLRQPAWKRPQESLKASQARDVAEADVSGILPSKYTPEIKDYIRSLDRTGEGQPKLPKNVLYKELTKAFPGYPLNRKDFDKVVTDLRSKKPGDAGAASVPIDEINYSSKYKTAKVDHTKKYQIIDKESGEAVASAKNRESAQTNMKLFNQRTESYGRYEIVPTTDYLARGEAPGVWGRGDGSPVTVPAKFGAPNTTDTMGRARRQSSMKDEHRRHMGYLMKQDLNLKDTILRFRKTFPNFPSSDSVLRDYYYNHGKKD